MTGRPPDTSSRVGQMLEAVGMTKNDLIRSTGISANELGEILSGARMPYIYEIAYLAKAFSVPPKVICPTLQPSQF